MKTTYLFAALAVGALVSVPLIAQTMGDRTQLRADVPAHIQKLFAMIDANHDGVLDQAELAAEGTKGDGNHEDGGHEGRMPMDRNAMFDVMDTNKDGNISRDEFARAPMGHHGGAGEMGNQRGMGGHDGHRGGGKMRMMAMADADKDGKVTLPEATAMALQHFDRADTNHDGKLTLEERQAAHAQMEKMRGQ